jgi:hypothetical protein
MTNSATMGSGTTAGALHYLDFLSTKGYMVPGAIAALKTAFIKVFSTVGEEGWENIQIRDVNVDDYMKRFGNMTHGKYNAKSLIDYKSRVNKVVGWYLEFLSKPGWTPPVKLRKRAHSTKNNIAAAISGDNTDAAESTTVFTPSEPQTVPTPTTKPNLVAFPFPLSNGVLASLYLPTTISATDAKRIARFVETLVIEESQDE